MRGVAVRRARGAAGARRTPAGRGGALARSSASSSFEQIGHFAVIRLWRQNSDVMRVGTTYLTDFVGGHS